MVRRGEVLAVGELHRSERFHWKVKYMTIDAVWSGLGRVAASERFGL